ncbi:MAG TPA: PHP domain-containing protein [Caldilineales bacterium]|nr:PHP domain-containing protein [Caldilineales bacterium]
MKSETESDEFWRVELHCHTRASFDSLTKPEDIVRACREKGIDRIAITDHNTMAGVAEVQALAPELVIPGEEIKTAEGEIIGWFMTEEIPRGLPLEETLRLLRAQGAVIGAPHPLDSLRMGSALGEETLMRIIDQVDALEALNARCLRQRDNDRALAIAKAHGKLVSAGSDAHAAREIGSAIMIMPPFHDADSFRRSLAAARIEGRLSGGHVRLYSIYAKIVKRALFRK